MARRTDGGSSIIIARRTTSGIVFRALILLVEKVLHLLQS